jgi:hypothetical protein
VGILHLSVQRFAWISLVLGAGWLVLAIAIGRSHRALEERGERLGA